MGRVPGRARDDGAHLLDRRAFQNAMVGVVASGGSTNGFLHLLAIPHEAEVDVSLDDLAEISANTPVIADLAPGGRWVAEDLHRVGGTRTPRVSYAAEVGPASQGAVLTAPQLVPHHA